MSALLLGGPRCLVCVSDGLSTAGLGNEGDEERNSAEYPLWGWV